MMPQALAAPANAQNGYLMPAVKFGANSFVNGCRAYTFAFDTGITIGLNSLSCTKAIARAALSTWNAGLTKTLANVGKTSFGISNFEQAVEAIRVKKKETLNFQGVLITKEDKREFSQRLGEASAHAFNGTCRLITVGGGSVAYVVGSVSNLLGLTAGPETLHEAAKSIASGFNKIGSYLPSAAWSAAKAAGSVFYQIGTTFLENPTVCSKGLLMSGTIYMAASNITKAVDTPQTLKKFYHAACAITGVALTLVIYQAQLPSQPNTYA